MTSLLKSVWNWFSAEPDVTELPSNILFERDVSPENDSLLSRLLDPTLEFMYMNGVVTKILDTDKCVINDKYHYQPKTDKEIRNFLYIERNSSVRISLYRKKNSNAQWNIASLMLNKQGLGHKATRVRENETVQVHLKENQPTVHVNDNNGKDHDDEEDFMTVEVLGEMPKVIGFELESTFQIQLRNNSYVKEKTLLDYRTMQGNTVQLSINNKIDLPLVIGVLSQYTFDITLKGKNLGRSTDKVEFIFDDMTYKVGVNINVIDPRIAVSNNSGFYRKEIDMQRIIDLQKDYVPGVRSNRRAQFTAVKMDKWNIPSQLSKCYLKECGTYNTNVSDIRSSIEKLYPVAFEDLNYQNYKAKFHILLFMEEIEITIALQKYAKDRIHFEQTGEYLVLKIPDLSEQRPSLIAGDSIIVTDPPNCTKRLGESGNYEGQIHKVLAEEIWLKFDPEFHSICGHWDYSVNFFHSRKSFRYQHHIVNELWKKHRLGEEFLFPYRDTVDYKPPKLEITSLDQINTDTSPEDEKTKIENKKELVFKPQVVQKIRWFNTKLNSEQKSAVINILKGEGRPMPYIIYGPPGTGKTVTLTEAIIQVYKQFPKSKLLICAPTNSAVDMLLGKLVNSGLFDKDIMKRIVGHNHYYSQSYDPKYDEYCAIANVEMSHLAPDDEKLILKRDILKLRIVITTEGTSGQLYTMGLKSGTFTHIFIDEAGQSKESEILLPLWFLELHNDGQVVLAGDPKQLGPVVMSQLAKSSGLGLSMLARFINFPPYQRDPNFFTEHNGYNPKFITHLIRNYRSLPQIVHTYSKFFYNSLLLPTKINNDVPEKLLLDNLIENFHWKEIGCKGPTIVIGVAGKDCQEPSSPSWFNPPEALTVVTYIIRLIKAGISASDIGVITPYAAQVAKINELLKMFPPDSDMMPKVGTVEMFQGQERMVIIMSIVRSKSPYASEKDKKFNMGFLVAKERVNVALSRAKALLIIIGDPSTMLRNNYFKSILSNAIKADNYYGCSVPEKIM